MKVIGGDMSFLADERRYGAQAWDCEPKCIKPEIRDHRLTAYWSDEASGRDTQLLPDTVKMIEHQPKSHSVDFLSGRRRRNQNDVETVYLPRRGQERGRR
jgi:hypothetical protein